MKTVSYSFFRNDHSQYESENCGEARGKVFVNYIRLIVRGHYAIWAGGGWGLRFYHDDRVMEFPYFKAMVEMEKAGLLKLYNFGKSTTLCGKTGMLERIRPIFESDAEYVVCRDVDSVPLPRDRRAVEEFVSSGRIVHAIHDASAHTGLMGGTLAVNAPKFRAAVGCNNFDEFVTKWPMDGWDVHGSDQIYMNRWVFPIVALDTLVHELHHLVGDMPRVEIRTRIDLPTPADIDKDTAAFGDGFSRVIGGCTDVEAPFAFYDKLDHPKIRLIQECERRAL